jgi:adenylylsulfate kinase-like enzyme
MEVAASAAVARGRTRLIVLRGNSGAGKSTVARELRAELGCGVAIVDQDTVRRKLARERDVEHGVNIGLIEHIVRYTLASDYVVILEGILHAGHYEEMLRRLHHDFGGGWYFLQVTWEESPLPARCAHACSKALPHRMPALPD